MIHIDNQSISKQDTVNSQSYNEYLPIQQQMAKSLISLARCALQQLHGNLTLLECTNGSEYLTEALLNTPHIDHFIASSLNPQVKERFEQLLSNYPHITAELHEADTQTVLSTEAVDIIAAHVLLQWIDEPSQFLANLSQQLKPGGIILLSTAIIQNHYEIKQFISEDLQKLSIGDLQKILAPLGNIVAQQHWQEKLCLDSPQSILNHIRLIGFNSLTTSLPIKKLEKERYPQLDNKKDYPFSYQPCLFVLKKFNDSNL